jgi:acyl carrier protein phosphodiesterase
MDLDQIVAEAHGPSAQAVAPALTPRQIILENAREAEEWEAQYADLEVFEFELDEAPSRPTM